MAASAAANTNSNDATANQAVAIDTSSDDAIEAALAAIQAETNEAKEIEALAGSEVEVIDLAVDAAPEEELDPEIAAILAEHTDDATVEAAADETPEVTEQAEAEPVVEAVTEDDVQDVIANDADELLAELEADAQAAPAAAPAKPARQKKVATPAQPATPKRDFYSIASIDAQTLKERLDACVAKKVVEKATNLIQAVEVGKRLSRYTGVAVQTLVAEGRVSGKKLVETFEAAGLSTGTARAQAQQMTALFKMTGVAEPDATAPRELVIADQALAQELVKLSV